MPERFFMAETGKGKYTAQNPEIFNSAPEENSLPECFSDELKMLRRVKFTLCTNTDIVQTLPSFVQALDTFENYLNSITKMYKEIKTRLIQYTLRLASAVKTYGVMTDNDELIAESSFGEDDLKTQTDDILLNRSSKILDDARKYLQAPNPFGIYHEIFVECETVMDDFGYAIGKQPPPAREKNSWKDEHDRLFINTHTYLKDTLDRLAESLKMKYPNFYREYQASRIVKKAGLKEI